MKTKLKLNRAGLLMALLFFVVTLLQAQQQYDCTNIPVWDAGMVYPTGGLKVQHLNKVYENKWWTQGDNPAESGQWGVWTYLGDCIGVIIPPDVTLTAPAAGSLYTIGDVINFSANATDSDGTVTSVEFYVGSTLVGTSAGPNFTYSWTSNMSGNFNATAKAIDNDGASAVSNANAITINGGNNIHPTIDLTSPLEGATYYVGEAVTISANAGDTDGTVAKVEFLVGATSVATLTASPYTTQWIADAPGNYTVTGIATDNENASTTSSAVNITVNPVDTGSSLALANLPLQMNQNQGVSETYTFDGPISSVVSRNRGVVSFTISGNSITITGVKAGRTGLKITSNGQHYYMGFRVNHADGSVPGLPQYLSIGSVSEDKAADLEFWEDIDTDLTNKEMDIRYIYINGGPLAGWRSWGPNRPKTFAENSVRYGLIPFFVYYNIPDNGESYEGDLQHIRDVNYMTEYFIDLNHFMDLVEGVVGDDLYGIVLEPDFLGYMQQNSGTTDPTQISCAVGPTTIAPGAGNVRTLVERINSEINARKLLGKNIIYGWQLNLWADPEAGYGKGVLRSTDDDALGFDAGKLAVKAAGENTTLFAIAAGTLTHGANFLSIDKYGLDAMGHMNTVNPADSRWFFNNDHWHNYLGFVRAMHETSGYPVVLWQLPVGHINSTQTVSAYTGGAFPDFPNTDTKYEDSSSDFFLGDVFTAGTTERLNYFSQNKYNDPKVSVAGNSITWGDHMQETKDAGVISVLFGAGVNSSTDGVGSPPSDDYFWIQKVQSYYEAGAPVLDKEYNGNDNPCSAGCTPTVKVLAPQNGDEVILTNLTPIDIKLAAFDLDGSVSSVTVTVDGQTFNPIAEGANYNVSWTPSVFGIHTITVSATDNTGGTSTTSISVTVTEFDPVACGVPAWDPNMTYSVKGTEVSYDGKVYKNKWWTQGDVPGNPDGPWEYVRNCTAAVKSASALQNIAIADDMKAYPNPFSAELKFSFNLKEEGNLDIKVYNALGAEVKSVLRENLNSGNHVITIDSEELPAGFYIYTIGLNNEVQSGTIIKE